MRFANFIKGSAVGFVVPLLGVVTGMFCGYYNNLYAAEHAPSSAGFFDTRFLDIPVALVVGGVLGGLIAGGLTIAALALHVPRFRFVVGVIAICLLLCGGSDFQYQKKAEHYRQWEQASKKQDQVLMDRHIQSVQSIKQDFTELQYPRSHIWHSRPGDPLSMTTVDTMETVVAYYESVLSTHLTVTDCSVGPSHKCWGNTLQYRGVSIVITISDDDLNDGGKTGIIIQEGQ